MTAMVPGSGNQSTPSRESIAGGAHYHAIKATKKWADYVGQVQEHATHTAAERERKDRDERNRSARAEAAGATTKGS